MNKLVIYTAKSRYDREWKRVETSFELLAKAFKNTKRTAETQEQYFKMDKIKQDNIKDVGGFIGATLKDNLRRNANILTKTLITLDIDYGKENIKDRVYQTYKDYSYIIYSTHKHHPKKPRVRLVFDISRECTSVEYEAVSRYIASMLDINEFDESTFEPARFMYYPSTSKDAEYLYHYNKAKPIDIDSILATYKNYQDPTQWSYHEKEKPKTHTSKVKAQDPLTKNGYIGTFCRAYPISLAIETFLSNVYEKYTNDRYTYINGSTAGGLAIYDNDTFATSNHATDPIHGLNVNAYDLVRLHLYGSSENSNAKMKELISKDKRCLAEQFASSRKINNKANLSWYANLVFSKDGDILPLYDNYHIIFDNDPILKGLGRYNQFTQRYIRNNNLPWQSKDNIDDFTEQDEQKVLEYLERTYGLSSNIQKIRSTITSHLDDQSFHPIKDYFNSLPKWDGVARVETIFCELFGVSDDEYTRDITKRHFLASVKRIFEPGCKYDYALVIFGEEGIGKSMFFEKLAHNIRWFSGDVGDISKKEAKDNLEGVWIVELAELSSIKKADPETVKAFLSARYDNYRKAYGKNKREYPRVCTFWGSTNEHDFLRSRDGNRKFLILEASKKRMKRHSGTLSSADIDQLWSEVYYWYLNDKKAVADINYIPEEIEQQAKKQRQEFARENIYLTDITNYVNTKVPINFEDWDTLDKITYYRANENERLSIMREHCNDDDFIIDYRKFYSVHQFIMEYLGLSYNDVRQSAKKEMKSALTQLDNDNDLVFDDQYRPDVVIFGNKYQPKGVLKRVDINHNNGSIKNDNDLMDIDDLF